MPDKGHELTDAMLKKLEKQIEGEYRQAAREIEQKMNKYFSDVAKQGEKQLERVRQGKMTSDEYKEWLTRKVAMGKRYEEMRDNLAKDMSNANRIAKQTATGKMADVYALNHNFATYQVESGGKCDTGYIMYNRQSVERLRRKEEYVMPSPEKNKVHKIPKDEWWNRRKIQSIMTQGIIQGESIPEISSRLARDLSTANCSATIRYARTMTTAAQNAGREDAFDRAEKMGVKMKKRWIATLDDRTRHSHAMLHGETVDTDEPFSNGLMFPADPSGDPSEVWNCRCTMRPIIDGFDHDVVKSSPKMGEMSFEEWQAAKAPKNEPPKIVNIAVTHGDPIERSPKKYREYVRAVLDAAPNNVKQAWNATQSEMYAPEFGDASGAMFRPWDQRCHFKTQKKAFDATDYQQANACFYHEYGHNIDWVLGKQQTGKRKYLSETFEGGTFGQTIYGECEDRMKEFWYQQKGFKDDFDAINHIQGGQYGMGAGSYIRQFLRQSMPMDEYRAIRSDLLDADEGALRKIFNERLKDNEYIKKDITSYMYSNERKELGKAFCKAVNDEMSIYQRTDISDMFEQYMIDKFDTTYPFGVGHGKKYWARDDAKSPHVSLGMEGFAEMYSASATQNDSLEAIKKMFPKSYAMFERMLEGAGK